MERACERIQESIAIESELGPEVRAHVASCEECGRLFSEYQALNLLVSDSGAEVPPGFADAVMERIAQGEESHPGWSRGLGNIAERIQASAPARWLLLGTGGVVAMANLIRFAFYVLIPR